jgi:hypothetical protein
VIIYLSWKLENGCRTHNNLIFHRLKVENIVTVAILSDISDSNLLAKFDRVLTGQIIMRVDNRHFPPNLEDRHPTIIAIR